jgi:hypothetical protein
MRLRSDRSLLWCILIVTVFSGCSSSQLGITYASSSPTTEEINPRSTPGFIISETFTLIPSPTFTEIPNPTPTSIVPQLATDLAPIAVDSKPIKLIENPVCSLPCWWGIIPGETSWGDVRNLLDYLSLSPESWVTGGYTRYSVNVVEQGSLFGNNVNFYEKNGSIDYLDIRSSFLQPNIERTWAVFDPKDILVKYGLPSRVKVYTQVSGEPSGPGMATYMLILFYDDQRFLINYEGKARSYSSAGIVVCPDFEKGNINSIQILAQSTGVNNIIEAPPPNKDWLDFYAFFRFNASSIDSVTGLDIKGFSDLFIGQNPSYCFIVKKP